MFGEKITKGNFVFLYLGLFLVSTAVGGTLYVDDDAPPGGGGSSWADAYQYLQDALAVAISGDEIHVAQGIYKPDLGGGQTAGNRNATLQLKNAVTIMGGYSGPGTADPYARDVELYETFLSGDLSGNDGEVANPLNLPNDPNRVENSIHVVTGSGTDETAVIDGFTITGGNANGAPDTTDPTEEPLVQGGGMYNYLGNPTVVNCIFQTNSADWYGGGMLNDEGSSPTLIDCIFKENVTKVLTGGVGSGGGAVVNSYSSNPILTRCTFIANISRTGGGVCNIVSCNPILTRCTFIANRSFYTGGGAANTFYCNPVFNQCTFINNSTDGSAGGMLNWVDSDPLVESCTFRDNTAKHGAGIYNGKESDPVIKECTFIGNEADWKGGGIEAWDNSYAKLYNCIFSHNSAQNGGGVYVQQNSQIILINCTFTHNTAIQTGGAFQSEDSNAELVNCILWENSPQEIYVLSGTSPVVNYSDVQGGWPGVGNIIEDPCFVNPTNDDYHLRSQAGHWDAVNLTWTQDNVTSLCIDTGDPASDYCVELWPHGGRINMGAYGGMAEASMSLDDTKGSIADLNCDGRVDIADFSLLSGKWMLEQYLLKEDMDRNGQVGTCDTAILCKNWLRQE